MLRNLMRSYIAATTKNFSSLSFIRNPYEHWTYRYMYQLSQVLRRYFWRLFCVSVCRYSNYLFIDLRKSLLHLFGQLSKWCAVSQLQFHIKCFMGTNLINLQCTVLLCSSFTLLILDSIKYKYLVAYLWNMAKNEIRFSFSMKAFIL